MRKKGYRSLPLGSNLDRRDFLKMGGSRGDWILVGEPFPERSGPTTLCSAYKTENKHRGRA
jgi:hypothetical protein